MGKLPADVAAELRRIGRVLTPETRDAFGSTLARFAHRVTAARSDSPGVPVATAP
jgi:hypothetical protein